MKKSATVLIALGVIFLAFTFTVPPYMTGQARALPTDLDLIIVSESPQGYSKTEHLITAPSEEVDEVKVRVEQTVEDSAGEVISEVLDQVTLIGHSRFPSLESNASISGTPSDHTNEVREGLHYFFPANTLRNSYQYYDIMLGDTEPVDYVSRVGDVYTFYQHRRFEPMDETTQYSVERTLEVERHSGVILNKHEIMVFHESDGDRDVEFSYTRETQELLEESAADITSTVKTARILDFSGKILGLTLLGIGVFQTGIFRARW